MAPLELQVLANEARTRKTHPPPPKTPGLILQTHVQIATTKMRLTTPGANFSVFIMEIAHLVTPVNLDMVTLKFQKTTSDML